MSLWGKAEAGTQQLPALFSVPIRMVVLKASKKHGTAHCGGWTDGKALGGLGGVWWGDRNVDTWEWRFLRCNGVFLSCIFQNNPWRADYSGFAEVGNSVLIHMIFLNACKSINIWIKTKWQFNFVCVYVWWYHANLIDVLEDKKTPQNQNTQTQTDLF